MVEQIQKCQKCGLYANQRPLLDAEKKCQIFWVGLSAKKSMSATDIPLSPETNTGAIIKKIEDSCDHITTYRTNLVKCLPLTGNLKLRYPNENEINCCFEHLQTEIRIMSPQIVFLLGNNVTSSVAKHMHVKFEKWNHFEYSYQKIEGIYYVPVHHPSYIYVYKRRNIPDYINGIKKIINQLLEV